MATAKKAAAKKAPAQETAVAAAPAVEAPAAAPAKMPNAAFMKPMTPSKDLAAVIGKTAVPRTEVTKKRSDGSEYTGTRGARIARKTGKEI